MENQQAMVDRAGGKGTQGAIEPPQDGGNSGGGNNPQTGVDISGSPQGEEDKETSQGEGDKKP